MSPTALRPPARASSEVPAPRRRLVLGLLGLAGALAAVSALSVLVGGRWIGAEVVIDAVLRFDPTSSDHEVVANLRIPRTAAGLLAGAALGLAGALMQGVTRNPLADPGLLGFNAGAAFAVVCAVGFLSITAVTGYIWFAFAGAAAVGVVVYAIAALGREGATPVKIALAGAAVNAALTAVTTAVLLMDAATFDQHRFWTVGSLTGRRMELVAQVAPFIAVAAVLALCTGRLLDALALGDDAARGLGQRVGRVRLACGAIAVVLCGAATATAGPIWFVGLVVPHLARLVTGPDYRWILPYSMLIAPTLLLVSDILGRVVARPGELQVGIVTSLIGAPFFILLIRRYRLARL